MNSKSNDVMQNDPVSLGQQLRAVGQGLESFEVEDFELQAEGDGYFVLGIPRVSNQAGGPSTLNKALHSLTRRSGADGKSAGSKVLRILITPEGIRRLEQEGKAKRREDSAGIPSFTRLAQILRMIGEYIDLQSGRLLKACKQRDSISFEYETLSGDRSEEIWKLATLAEFWIRISNNRLERQVIFEQRPNSAPEDTIVEAQR
jgi:hypothetical protein